MSKFLVRILIFFVFYNSVWANLFISEIYPNTIDDANLEYIELYNSWSSNLSLSWYILKDKSEKEYVFWTWDFIESFSGKKIFRTESKILLNNSDEELYLYDNTWTLIDSFSYNETTEWEIIEIIDIDNSRVFWWEIETNSWELSSSWELIDIPNIEVEVQSWLDFLTWNIWKCKSYDCKINLSVENIFTWSFDINNYSCLWDFWTWATFSTWTDEKCNPWYVNYLSWTYNIDLKVFETNNKWNYKTWWIIIQNNNSATVEEWGWDRYWWTLSWIIQDFELKYNFQNPTYILDKDTLSWTYICDNSKDECKLNLDLRDSFNDYYSESDFDCEIDFWFDWWLNWEENKCNPSTIVYPKWEFNLSFKIVNKTDSGQVYTWWFLLENKVDPIIEEKIVTNTRTVYEDRIVYLPSPLTPLPEGEGNSSNESIDIETPEIIIQSWLDENNNCKKEDCNLNLNYESKNSKEVCLWDFDWWVYTSWTEKKCNPWYVKYKVWNYKVKLKVYEAWNEENFKESFLEFGNERDDIIVELDPIIQWDKNEYTMDSLVKLGNDNNNKPIAKISLQWRVGKTKKQSWNLLECFWVDKCSVNLDWSQSYDLDNDIESFDWDLWNWETFSWVNPPSFWYEKWYYKISLKVIDSEDNSSEDYFYVDVKEDKTSPLTPLLEGEGDNKETIISLEEESYQKDNDLNDFETNSVSLEWEHYNYSNIKINRVNPNPFWNDTNEFIELINIGEKSINLKWCFLDDIRDWWSKAFEFKDDYFFNPLELNKIYKVFSKLNLNNTEDEVNLICNDKIIDSFKWDFSVKDWEILDKNYINTFNYKDDINLEEYEKIKNKEVLLDLNNDKIPDCFNELSSTWNTFVIDLKESNKKYCDYVEKEFNQKIIKDDSWLIVEWKTIPKSQIFINLKDDKTSFFDFIYKANAWNFYSTFSDENWDYSLNLWKDFSIGDYKLETFLIDNLWNKIEIWLTKTFKITESYYKKLNKKIKEDQDLNKEIIKEETEDNLDSEILINDVEKNNLIDFKWKLNVREKVFLSIILFLTWIILVLLILRKKKLTYI